MSGMFEQDNPSNQVLVFPYVIKRYDSWTGRASFDLVSVGQKVAHFCPDCANWWGIARLYRVKPLRSRPVAPAYLFSMGYGAD